MIINYGSEGHAIKRYPTTAALCDAIREGENCGSPFLIAEEMEMVIIDRKVDNEKPRN